MDWDAPVLAPIERDLMFIGAGIGGVWNKAAETAFFYQGYGAAEINPIAVAYYRYEHIVQDIATFCHQIFRTTGSAEEREFAVRCLTGQFQPGGEVETARESDAQ